MLALTISEYLMAIGISLLPLVVVILAVLLLIARFEKDKKTFKELTSPFILVVVSTLLLILFLVLFQ